MYEVKQRIEIKDGRSELYQWDTGVELQVNEELTQIHMSVSSYGTSLDVDVVDGVAKIPDILLQKGEDLNVWGFIGTEESGFTKTYKKIKVNRRNKPADYIYTPENQTSMQKILAMMGDLDKLNTDAKENLVSAINEALTQGGEADYNKIAEMIETYLKENPPEPGTDGKDGTTFTPTVSKDGVLSWSNNGNLENPVAVNIKGTKGEKGDAGAQGPKGNQGKTAYEYARDGGYTGTEAEFAEKLAKEITQPDWNASEGETGHILNRTHYSERTAEVLQEATYEFAEGSEVMLPSVLDITEGETYTVTWDGVEYSCTCKHLAENIDGMDMEAMLLGNAAAFGESNSGEPFVVGNLLQPMNVGMAISMFDYGEHTMGIMKETVHKLPLKYLPDAFVVNFDFPTMTADKTCDEIWKAMQEKRSVFLKLSDGNRAQYSPCVYCEPGCIALFVCASMNYQDGVATNIIGLVTIGVRADGSVLFSQE